MHKIEQSQQLPISIDTLWKFFLDPENLKKITPLDLSFQIKSGASASMYAGMIVIYSMKPFMGIPITWVMEITHVEEKKLFIDEQRDGPCSFWHHQHHFKTISNGVEMTDILHYKLPLGILGKLFNHLVVKSQMRNLFQYRNEKMQELFGTYEG